ncbi:MAG: hypothetical protein GY881_12640 [Gammaproteobacteria bacterium]|nr:hypothetical protein [Gammaproteobacteria bacterium]MCP4880836.1 hypothetical protein [Gammaproteobacteria bacterium]MDP6166825.1 hypothetical protein [Gammaproteobacteria bacterium]
MNTSGEIQGTLACAMPTSRTGNEDDKACALMKACLWRGVQNGNHALGIYLKI